MYFVTRGINEDVWRAQQPMRNIRRRCRRGLRRMYLAVSCGKGKCTSAQTADRHFRHECAKSSFHPSALFFSISICTIWYFRRIGWTLLCGGCVHFDQYQGGAQPHAFRVHFLSQRSNRCRGTHSKIIFFPFYVLLVTVFMWARARIS